MKRLPVALSIVSLAGVSGTAQTLSWWDRGNNAKVGPTETLQQSHKYFKQQPSHMPLEKYASGSYECSPAIYNQYQMAAPM